MSIRVYKLAEKIGIESKQLIDKLKELNIIVKSHMSSLEDDVAEIIIEELKGHSQVKQLKEKKKKSEAKTKAKPVVEIDFPVTVKQLAVKLSCKPGEFIKKLIGMGIFANINAVLDRQNIDKIGKKFGIEIKETLTAEEKVIEMHSAGKSENLVLRPPVVTLMGHVDHGKTSVLEKIKKVDLTKKESGGITQHIGAYEIKTQSGKVTFLDTPGHEAFTSLRARGAHVTDLVILVVAADDGIMPQTEEAINHSRAAKVPIIVAINKIDKPNADIDKVKKQLSEYDLTPEDWGGKTITVEVSAKTGEGIEELIEMLLLEAELLQLKADPYKSACGIIIEAELSKGKGPLAHALVQSGTLKIDQIIVAGEFYGKIKALIDASGKNIKEAPPSTPVEILGLSGVPLAGEQFYVVKSEDIEKQIVLDRQKKRKSEASKTNRHITLEDLHAQIQSGKISHLNLIIKTDVHGSLEALIDSLSKIPDDEVKMNIIHKSVGVVKESDVMLAAASNAVIIAFHIGIGGQALECAKREGVEIKQYSIIYQALEEIKASIEGMLEPESRETEIGEVQVREVFDVSKTGRIAGSYVVSGKINRNSLCRLLRKGEIIYEGKINSLKRFKNDVSEVKKDYECGIGIQGCTDIQKGDYIKVYQIEKIPKKL